MIENLRHKLTIQWERIKEAVATENTLWLLFLIIASFFFYHAYGVDPNAPL